MYNFLIKYKDGSKTVVDYNTKTYKLIKNRTS